MKSFLKKISHEYPIEEVFCGGDPRLVLMDKEGNEIEEIELYSMDEQQISNLIESKGFEKF